MSQSKTKFVCRRKGDPRMVQKLWTAINSIRSQKQVANMERICKAVMKNCDNSFEEIEQQLRFAVEDELIVAYRAMAQKGNNAGLEQDAYRVPSHEQSEEEDKSDHDWYCYNCHLGGLVMECLECWRVYHQQCTSEVPQDQAFICPICQETQKEPTYKRKELNKLLAFTVLRLKEKSKELHFFCGADQGLDRFVFYYIDLNMMQEKSKNKKYQFLEQFHADSLTILHNIFICYGDIGILPHLARVMIIDCKYDLDEIRQCKDCYMHSNTKPKDWFCQPCRPPHQLVYAKQKGFSYWPAKVIKVTEEGYDVRFFGSQHERAVIPESNIKPIDSNMKGISLKRTVGFNKALKELTIHKELLKQQQQLEQLSNDEESQDENGDDEEEKEEKERKKEGCEKVRRSTSSCHPVSSSLKGPFESQARRSYCFQEENNYQVTSSQDKVSTEEDQVKVEGKKNIYCRQPNKSTQTDQLTSSASSKQTENIDIKSLVSKINCPLTSSSSDPDPCGCRSQCGEVIGDLVTRMRKDAEQSKVQALEELENKLWKESGEEQQRALNRALTSHQREMERLRGQVERVKEEMGEEMRQINSMHAKEISHVKKKQWCYNCEEESMYHCCWNTSYCSIKCQQEHWHLEHKKMCKRKRNQ